MTETQAVNLVFKERKALVNPGLFIGNKFIKSVSGKTFTTVNPATGEAICQVYEGDAQDIELAVKEAKKGFVQWSKFNGIERSDFLYKISQAVLQNQDELAFVEALDQGKALTIAKKYDVAATAFTFKYYAGWADKHSSKFIPGQNSEMSFTRHEPFGVTAGIIPWVNIFNNAPTYHYPSSMKIQNYPLMMLAWKVAPALACGNVIIIKPSEKTPLSALLFAEIVRKILPPGVVQIVNGYGPTAGAALAQHLDVKKIAFTGSTPVGRKILEMSSKSNLKKVSLELGGKSPNIICNDADLKLAVPCAAVGVFANAGQVCCACTRIYVQEEIYDRFASELKKYAESLTLNDQWLDAAFFIGPIVDRLQYERVRSYIELGVSEGATLLGEIPPKEPKGFFVKPTIFTNTREDMRIVKEEIFGPVAVLCKFKTITEVLSKANDSHYGLGAAVFSQNIDTCLALANGIDAGTVWVNHILLDVYSQQLPFGGYKESGFGREGSEYSLSEWTQVKTIKIKYKSKL